MIAIVIVLAATASAFLLGVSEDINEPAPNVADTTGKFVIDEPDAYNNQIIRITHLSGESVPVKEIEIIVRASGPTLDKDLRLINLPSEGSTVAQNNIEGDDIIDQSGRVDDLVIVEDIPADNNRWDPGETIQFRITTGEADFRDSAQGDSNEADTLEVIIVHTPSDAIISEHRFTP